MLTEESDASRLLHSLDLLLAGQTLSLHTAHAKRFRLLPEIPRKAGPRSLDSVPSLATHGKEHLGPAQCSEFCSLPSIYLFFFLFGLSFQSPMFQMMES